MSWLEGRWARLRSLVQGRAAEARMEEEFRFHVEMETSKYLAQGVSAAEARRRALASFGGFERHREGMRDVRRPRLLAEVRQDVRFALRSLRHSPVFAVLATLVIALGIGATTSLFSLANAFMFRPLPVASPGELYQLQEVRWGAVSIGSEGRRLPYTRYEAYRDATSGLFRGLAAHTFQTLSLRTASGAEAVQGVLTSPNYFQVLGVTPALGRWYRRDDEAAAVISHRMWQRHFAGDREIIGRQLYVDGRSYTVAGVAPAGFEGTMAGIGMSVWLPFRAHASSDPGQMQAWVGMFGRLREAQSVDRVSAAVSAIAKQIPPDETHTRIERAYVVPFTGVPESSRDDIRAFMTLLLGAGGLILLIAAANIAALLLARALARHRELGLRVALGAARLRLVRQLLTETTVLFVLGGVAGIVLAYGGTALLARLQVPGIPLVLDVTPDLRVLAFALVVSVITGLVFGLAPALRATRRDLADVLKSGPAMGASTRTRGRSIFVAGQLALATVLLVAAVLFVRGLQQGLAAEIGFRADGVVVGTLNLEAHGYDQHEGRAFVDELMRRVRALPEVESAAVARVILLTGSRTSNDVSTTGAHATTLGISMNIVDTAYFATMRVPLVAGRGFNATDARGAPGVVVVNETLAGRFWPGRNPVGQVLRRGSDEFRVIGVTRDGKYADYSEAPQPFAFFAAEQSTWVPRLSLHVRARHDAAPVIRSVRRELQQLNPDVALESALPLNDLIGFVLFPYRLAAGIVGLFGVLGLCLAVAGIYGVVSYQVSQRTREFGIRIALGADAAVLRNLVLGRGLRVIIVGTLLGLAGAAAIGSLLRSMLFGLSPLDPLTFVGVAVILAAAGLLASWAPARRALRVDPSVSLRAE